MKNIKKLIYPIEEVKSEPKPDALSVRRFKNKIQKYLKSGYKINGLLVIEPDGTLKQKMTTE